MVYLTSLAILVYSRCIPDDSEEPGEDGEPDNDGVNGKPGEPGEPGRPRDNVDNENLGQANFIIVKAKICLYLNCCYMDSQERH